MSLNSWLSPLVSPSPPNITPCSMSPPIRTHPLGMNALSPTEGVSHHSLISCECPVLVRTRGSLGTWIMEKGRALKSKDIIGCERGREGWGQLVNASTWSTTSESQVIGVRAGQQEQSPLSKIDPMVREWGDSGPDLSFEFRAGVLFRFSFPVTLL